MRTSKIFVTVDAVVFRKSGSDFEILFIKRKNEPFKGKWALPGGFVDEGEDLPIAAVRELQEETGLVVNAMEQLGAFGNPGRDPRSHTVSLPTPDLLLKMQKLQVQMMPTKRNGFRLKTCRNWRLTMQISYIWLSKNITYEIPHQKMG